MPGDAGSAVGKLTGKAVAPLRSGNVSTTMVAAIWFKTSCGELKNRTRHGAKADAARKLAGSEAGQPRSFKPQTTDSKHGLPVCANLLQDGANAPTGGGEVFIGDINYLRLREGSFCCLACLQDKFTRRIVGWKVSTRMTAQLVIDVFLQARKRGLIKRNAIIRERSRQSICFG